MKDYSNIFEGFGNLLELFPTISTPKIRPVQSSFQDDRSNLAQDWQNIGNDLRKAMNESETNCR